MASKTQTWCRRAEQARRLAPTLSPHDAAILRDYAKECEYRGLCSSDPRGRGPGECPLGHEESHE